MVNYYKKIAQVARPLDEIVEQYDDQGNVIEQPQGMGPTTIDWDMTPEEAQQMMADDYVEEDEDLLRQQQEDQEFEEKIEEPYEPPDVDPDIPIMGNTEEALKWAIENRRTLLINYDLKKNPGRGRSRGGRRLKREIGVGVGGSIRRVVEPHHMFQAGNGNLIVVTWDRSVGAIRAFIVPNITSYSILDKSPRNPFKIKQRVLPKSVRGMSKMENIQGQLKQASSQLAEKKLTKTAEVVKDTLQAYDNLKTAQYVGIQGYWLRNRRCWDNCYRQKRTSSPKTSAQEVWSQCWDEYLASLKDPKSGWEKYAAKENIPMNIEKDAVVRFNWLFAQKVEAKVADGYSIPEAIYETIDEQSMKYFDDALTAASNLTKVASTLKENGHTELGDTLGEIAQEITKEADFSSGGWLGKALGPVGRGLEKAKNWWTGKGSYQDATKLLQDLIAKANALMQRIDMGVAPAKAPMGERVQNAWQALKGGSAQSIIIEAGKGVQIKEAVLPQQVQQNPEQFRNLQPGKPIKPTLRAKPDGTIVPSPDNPLATGNEAPLNKPAPPAAAAGGNAVTTPVPSAGLTNTVDTTPPPAPEGAVTQTDTNTVTSPATESPVAEPAAAPAAGKKAPDYSGMNAQFQTFTKDVSKLMSDLSGFASQGDPQVSTLVQNVTPALQNYINTSGQVLRQGNPSQARQFLSQSLKDLVSGVQTALAGGTSAPAAEGGIEGEGTVPAGAGEAGAGTTPAGAPSTGGFAGNQGAPQGAVAPQGGKDPMDTYLDGLDYQGLFNLQKKIYDRLQQRMQNMQGGQMNAAASVSRKKVQIK